MSTIGGSLVERLVGQQVIAASDAARLGGTPAEVVAQLLAWPGLDGERLAQVLAGYMGLDYCDPHLTEADGAVASRVALLEKHGVRGVPLAVRDGLAVVAVPNPLEPHLEERLRAALEQRVRLCIASGATIERLRGRHLNAQSRLHVAGGTLLAATPQTTPRRSGDEGVQDSPVVRLVETLLHTAVERRASDVHIEARRGGTQVRFRIDGVLHEAMDPLPLSVHDGLITRIKVLAELDVAERRAAQDGRFSLRIGEENVDFRVSILPCEKEDATLRLLRHKSGGDGAWRLDELGLSTAVTDGLRHAVRQPQGLVLVTGPTGSGKTTTLYAVLGELDARREKIVTIEDPVEYQLDGVTQIAVNESKKFTFANGLRSVLRHDPDKIMVGEIRDRETADIAVQSALTGHLVLSTVHANGALEAVSRFAHMGVARPFIVEALHSVFAQRLMRVLCPRCKELAAAAPEIELSEAEQAALREGAVYQARGCAHCGFTGYQGRRAVGEFIRFTPELKELLLETVSTEALRRMARAQGMQSLRRQALQQALAGQTSLEEVARVTAME